MRGRTAIKISGSLGASHVTRWFKVPGDCATYGLDMQLDILAADGDAAGQFTIESSNDAGVIESELQANVLPGSSAASAVVVTTGGPTTTPSGGTSGTGATNTTNLAVADADKKVRIVASTPIGLYVRLRYARTGGTGSYSLMVVQ